jgi:hypothetical protein
MIWPAGVKRVTVSGPSLITMKPAVVTASTGYGYALHLAGGQCAGDGGLEELCVR